MKLFFKTPYYKNSNFIAHLVEHCILHPSKNDVEQWVLTTRLTWSLHWEFSYITYDSFISKEKISTLIYKPITQDIIDYEYKIFEEEFGSVNYVMRVLEKLAKGFFWDSRTGRQQKYEIEEIKAYHEKHYINWEYVLINDDGVLIEHNIQNIINLEQFTISPINYELIYLEWQKNLILYSSLNSYIDTLYYFFLYDVIKSRDTYKKRFDLESYYYHSPSDLYTSNHCVIRISPHTALDVTEDFFNSQKAYFINHLKDNWYSQLHAQSLLYLRQKYDIELAVSMIENISYSSYKEILDNIKKL